LLSEMQRSRRGKEINVEKKVPEGRKTKIRLEPLRRIRSRTRKARGGGEKFNADLIKHSRCETVISCVRGRMRKESMVRREGRTNFLLLMSSNTGQKRR